MSRNDALRFGQKRSAYGHRLDRQDVIALLVVILGILVRFWALGAERHGYDNAYPAYDALKILDSHHLLLVSQPSSVFLDNPALMPYLQAVMLAAWRSLWAIYLPIVALNSLAIWFVYRTGKRALGAWVGLVAAFLLALNPWVVRFSRQTWMPALMPLFTSIIAWGVWPVLISPADGTPAMGDARPPTHSARVFMAGIALAAMTQCYIQSWGMLAQLGPLLLAYWRKVPKRALYGSAALLVLLGLVYGVGVARRWQDNRAKLQNLSSGGLHLTREGLDHAVRLVTGRDYDYVYTRGDTATYAVRREVDLALHYLLLGALAAGGLRAFLGIARGGPRRPLAIVLLVWFLVPVMLTSVTTKPVHPYYLLLTSPAGVILAAWGLEAVWRWRIARAPLLAFLAAVGLAFALNLYWATTLAAASPLMAEFDGWTLAAASRAGETIRKLTAGDLTPRRLVVDGDEAILTSLVATPLRTLRDIKYPSYVLLPGYEPLTYVLVNQAADPAILGPRGEGFPQYDQVGPDGSRVSFLRVQPYSRDEALALAKTQVEWPSESGLTLLGYTVPPTVTAGTTLNVTTFWRVDDLKAERNQWFVAAFYHIVRLDGSIVSNVSGRGEWGSVWRVGDVFVERMSIPVPPELDHGRYRLDVGLFDPIHSRGFSLLMFTRWRYSIKIPIRIRTP